MQNSQESEKIHYKHVEGRKIFRDFKKYFFEEFSSKMRPSGLSLPIEKDRQDIAKIIALTFGEYTLFAVEEPIANKIVDIIMALVFCHKFKDAKY